MNNKINQLGPIAIQHLHANDFINAEKVVLQILAINANEFNALKIYAFILANQNRLQESIAALEKAHQIKKNDPEIAFNLGKAFFDTKQWIESIKFYKIFLRLTKPDPLVLMDIGTAYRQVQNPAEAIQYFNDALISSPNNPAILNNKVAALIDLKRYSEALELSELVVALDTQSPSAWNNRGNALMKLQHYEASLEAITSALRIDPNHLEALINYGNAFSLLKQTTNALTAYTRAVEIEPHNIENYINLGNAYADLKQFDLALSSYATAVSFNPNHKHLKGSQLHIHSILCLWDDTYQELIKSLQKQPEPSLSTPFPLLSKIDEPELHKLVAQEYCSDVYPKYNDLGPIIKKPHQKIRLAYFSADFRNHPVASLTAELFELHNRSEFEIYGFYFGAKTTDEMHLRIKAAFDYFIPCEHLTDIELARLAREYEIDIAVDLMGHTQSARTGAFAYRAASVQVNFLGYPGTSGAEYMDYILADKTIIPDELANNYSEQISYIETYQPNDSKKVISNRIFTRSELGLSERGLVFACFNNNYKITPNIFACWMNIMSAIPDSSLLLSSDNVATKENLIRAASQYGITSERIIFAQRLDLLSDHLARHQIADLFLDTFPYSAHTTASDALWSGLPVLTLAGKSFASRVAASLLTAIGLPELITYSEQEYELKAIELASNPQKLAAIKEKLIANRLTTPLFDTQRYAKSIELAYKAMIQGYEDGSKFS